MTRTWASSCAGALALGALACATGSAGRAPVTTRPAPAAAVEAQPAAIQAKATATDAAARQLSPAARRLFDEAVAASDAQERAGGPADWDALERRWRAVAEAQPIPEAFFNVGVTLERRGRLDEARQAYRRALSIDAGFGPAAVNLALLDEPEDPAEAARTWTELRRRHPDEAVPCLRLAALYERAGQLDDAWALAREALLRDRSAVAAYKVMMRVALRRDQLDLAQLLAVKARKVHGPDPEVEAFVGDVLLRQDDEVAAIVQWRKAIALQGDFLPARFALLSRAVHNQQWSAVAEQARAILKTTPSDARVHLALGVAYRYLGRPDDALAEYEQAERLDGRLAEVHLARGVTLMRSKEQCAPAIAELRRYIADVGPAAAAQGAAPRLARECEQLLAQQREAEDAAREMKAHAERDAARTPARPVQPTGASPGEASAQGTGVPAR